MGFRGQILNWIYNQLCINLLIDNPEESYQNAINPDLNNLKIGDKTHQISITAPGNKYLAPRQPKLLEFSTPLRRLYNRPTTQNDVTGLKVENGFPKVITPSAFIHIVTAEKDLYFPSRRIPAEGRLNDQIEFLKIGIDCVLRDETEPIAGTSFQGNGEFWKEQVKDCVDPIPPIETVNGYQPLYYRPINQQATDFVEDTERILSAGTLRNMVFQYGPPNPTTNQQAEAKVMNVILGIWGMLPNSENSPTDTVRCIYELEIHYPKVPGLC